MDERVNILIESWRQTVEQGANYKALLIILFAFTSILLFLVFWLKIKELISLKF